jgi:hypothetical protein
MRSTFANRAIITNTSTEQSVEVEADNMRENQSFDAYVVTNKIRMRWNGKIYVGNAHGMEFTSYGPKEYKTR